MSAETPTSQPRKWRVTSHTLVLESSAAAALDAAEQLLREPTAQRLVRIDLLCEATGETVTRTVEL